VSKQTLAGECFISHDNAVGVARRAVQAARNDKLIVFPTGSRTIRTCMQMFSAPACAAHAV